MESFHPGNAGARSKPATAPVAAPKISPNNNLESLDIIAIFKIKLYTYKDTKYLSKKLL